MGLAIGSEADLVARASVAAPARSQSAEPSAYWRWWQWALPAAVTLCMTLWGITGASFWRDEAATLSVARRSMPAFWRMLDHTDVVHGLYYLILWPLVRVLGFSELGARLPSAVAVVGATIGVTAIGRRLLSARVGLAAGLTFAIFPLTSRYGQEARSYAIVMALAVFASYGVVRLLAVDEPGAGRRRWLVAYAAVVALMGWSNLISLLIVPAHAVTLLWSAQSACAQLADGQLKAGALAQWRLRARGWLIAVAVAGAAVFPLVAPAWRQRHRPQRVLGTTTFFPLWHVPPPPAGSLPGF